MFTTSDMPIASPFQTILSWAEAWPAWQRDALRRIVINGQLSATDCDELHALCKAQHGLMPEAARALVPVPLSTDHIPSGPDAASSVSLVKLGTLKNVNRLPSDQAIEFGPAPGLTVIYGENGSGKSGYVRVIKKACRARGTAPDIKPNAFDGPAIGPATAEILCSVGPVQTPLSWTDGVLADPRLSNIFVFDATSARFHVTDDGPAVFTPRGLDVLPKLARVCDELKRRLKEEADAILATTTQIRDNWRYKPETAVGKLLTDLSEATKEADIDKAADFTTADQKRLAELAEALKSDPKQRAQATTAAAARIRAFAALIETRSKALDDTAMATVHSALREAAEADVASKAVTSPKFDDSFLPGTGGDAWRQLWDIARAYSQAEAYPTKEFPVTDTGARCVLCQQALGPEASDRFARFDDYVRDEARLRAEAARAKLSALTQALYAIELLAPEHAKVAADLAAEAPEALAAMENYVIQADVRLTEVKRCLSKGVWSGPPSLPASPVASLRNTANAFDTRAKMELSADNPEKRKMLAAELAELEDKEWLYRNKAEVLKTRALLNKAGLLTTCQQDTVTNSITIRSGDLHDALVTKAFCERFENEMDTLELKTLPVKLQSIKGAKGERRFGVRLDATTTLKVGDVASEGEHSCIALAAFLAELSQASHRSALVFDDPVSSLDHKRRATIAARLVAEAKIRQVLVFTHDLAFLCDLQTCADEQGLEIHGRHLDWSATAPGRCHGELPWEGQKHKGQMKRLRELCGKAAKISREKGQEEYRAFARFVCDLIRAAAERAIEEELFNHVLRRHESRLQVGRLESVGAVELEDYKAVTAVWKACSEVTPSHSSSRAKPPEVPDPAKLKEHVDTLERVVKEVKRRRQEAISAMPSSKPPPPVTLPPLARRQK